MQIFEKNKAVLSFAAVTIGGAMIFAATTGVGGGARPEPEPVQEAPAKPREPAKPTTSFADMVGEYEPDVDPETGEKIPANDAPNGGFGAQAVANAQGIRDDAPPARPVRSERPRQAQRPNRPTGGPAGANVPEPGRKGARVSPKDVF